MNTKSIWVRCLVTLASTSVLATSVAASVTPASAASTEKTLKVALVAPSAVNDLAFTESMVAALEQLKTSYNLKISISDNEFVVADAANLIRQYAASGYNLVIAHGSQYGSTLPTGSQVPQGLLRLGHGRLDLQWPTSTLTKPTPTKAGTCRAIWPVC